MISTDASVFEIFPADFVYPKDHAHLLTCVRNALAKQQAITLRAGGTSLGGQAIGAGLLVDVSKHLTHILDYRPALNEIVVEPGVIQDDLNAFLKNDNLLFAPDTSTSNRAMIGGMIGNNSCGAYSIYYGTTREHVKSVAVILADGSQTTFHDLTPEALQQKQALPTLEGQIYRTVVQMLSQYGPQIVANFPHPSIIRRTTGYALDVLYQQHQPFNPNGKPFNLTPLICGSEGTLAVITQATLNLVPRPRHRQVFCAQFHSIDSALTLLPDYLKHQPAAVELIDKITLDATQNNKQQSENRSWIQGQPAAVLVVELFADRDETLQNTLKHHQAWMLTHGAYACPIIAPQHTQQVWNLRKAGLGVLMGSPTRKKAIAVIEDAALPVEHLLAYYQDIQALMAELNLGCVYYGHASVGLIHVRPEIDLATQTGQQLYLQVAQRSADIVKKYRGAISGEHGDGRIRAPYIEQQVGKEVYQLLVQLKQTFDPHGLFNPGVIIGKQSIVNNLRAHRQPQQRLTTGYDWSNDLSLMDAVEKCNGAGACRKSAGNGTMCPSYQATREEDYSTRGRSNLLRLALTEANPIAALNQQQLQQALSLCLGCKSCKTECPASVDMTKLKSEVLYQTQPISIMRYAIQFYGPLMQAGALMPKVYNWVQNQNWMKQLMGVAPQRALPPISQFSLKRWYQHLPSQSTSKSTSHLSRQPTLQNNPTKPAAKVWLLIDLYSQYQEPNIGQAAIQTLRALGQDVEVIFLKTSPRALLSQGLLAQAKQALLDIQTQLVNLTAQDHIVGLEPSDTLVWRDEAADLLPKNQQAWWLQQVLLFEEWVLHHHAQTPIAFPALNKTAWLHVHCHQKALAQAAQAGQALELIPQLNIHTLATGCCGMSGAFGYQNYALSQTIANQSLLPALKQAQEDDIIIATGTSCRHQISDLAQGHALHPCEVFWLSLKQAKKETETETQTETEAPEK